MAFCAPRWRIHTALSLIPGVTFREAVTLSRALDVLKFLTSGTLTRHQHVQVLVRDEVEGGTDCALAGAGDGLNLILHQLAHTRVKSEYSPAEVSSGTPQWLKSQPQGKNHKICGTTLEYKYQDWASSVANICVIENIPRCTWRHDCQLS